MIGTYEVKVSNTRVDFTLTLERNITVIRGDSATGKSTFIGLIRDYEQDGDDSGVRLHAKSLLDNHNCPCRVLNSVDWQFRLGRINNSIVFIDEGNGFIKSDDFARAIQGSTNYYVIITRENLHQLPYSVKSILKLKTTTRQQKTYIRSYKYYARLDTPVENIADFQEIITEDSNSGYEMFNHIAMQHGVECISARGKSNVFNHLHYRPGERLLVIADGAAFGAELEKVYKLAELHPRAITLFLPESFEWLILKSRIIRDSSYQNILMDPSSCIESEWFVSWERYFTDLLIHLTENTPLQYRKSHLNPVYLLQNHVDKLIETMQNL